MFGILAANAVAYQQVRRASGVEQEVSGKRRDTGYRRAGQIGGMDEYHRRAFVQRGEQVVLAGFAEVGARVVGQQHHTVGVEVVERADGLVDGLAEVWHRDGGEEPEPIRV